MYKSVKNVYLKKYKQYTCINPKTKLYMYNLKKKKYTCIKKKKLKLYMNKSVEKCKKIFDINNIIPKKPHCSHKNISHAHTYICIHKVHNFFLAVTFGSKSYIFHDANPKSYILRLEKLFISCCSSCSSCGCCVFCELASHCCHPSHPSLVEGHCCCPCSHS